jgi:hypothetical protein
MNTDELVEQWQCGNCNDVVTYLMGRKRKAQLIAFVVALGKVDTEDVARLLRFVSWHEG